jgi:hypothetical protein
MVAVEKQKVLHILSVCVQRANAHAPFCHPWPVWLYHIFPHYPINGTILEKT